MTVPGRFARRAHRRADRRGGRHSVGDALAYFYGDLTVNNPEYYKHIVTRLGTMLDERSKANEDARAAGCIVNTMGWIDGVGLELLLHAREALRIDHVFVIGQERLFGQLQQKLNGTDCQVFRLQKSSGAVDVAPRIQTSVSRPNVQGILLRAHGRARARVANGVFLSNQSVPHRWWPESAHRWRCPSDRRRQRIPCAAAPWFPPRLFYTPSWR